MRVLIVAGEPGGSIAATRERIEQRWGARVIDHYGLTEVGPDQLRVLGESRLPASQRAGVPLRGDRSRRPATRSPDGQLGELVVTNLGRTASPGHPLSHRRLVMRVPSRVSAAAATFARLEGGVLARTDDMVNVRGVNVYPAAIESVVRRWR